jgi:hypothetical protein
MTFRNLTTLLRTVWTRGYFFIIFVTVYYCYESLHICNNVVRKQSIVIVCSHHVTTVRNSYIQFYATQHTSHGKHRGQSIIFPQLMCEIVIRHLRIILF